MDFILLVEADKAGFALEQARQGLETAKSTLELCKQNYEDILVKAEEAGIPRAKFKKIVEERVQALYDNGFAETNATPAARPSPRPKKAKKTETPVDETLAEPLEPMPEHSGEALDH